MAPTKRKPLNRERILRAALAVADAHGADAVTMRRLGDELGFEAMSLYRHVANKDDLLDGMLDLVLAETEPPAPAAPWDAAIRSSAISVYEALGRHPWATRLLMTPQHVRPARIAYMDSLLGALRAGGFSAEVTYTAYHVLDAHIFGFSLWHSTYERAASMPREVIEKVMRDIDFAELPHMREHRDLHLAEGPHREVDAFTFGLDLILQGLKNQAA